MLLTPVVPHAMRGVMSAAAVSAPRPNLTAMQSHAYHNSITLTYSFILTIVVFLEISLGEI